MAVASAAAPALAQTTTGVPESTVLPRNMTRAEEAYVNEHQLPAPTPVIANPPTGPIHCTAEYEPVSAIIVGWQATSSGINTILGKMGARITNEGNADFYVVVNGTTGQNTAISALTSQGANM